MRLDKYLSHCGVGTRNEVRQLIKQGVVEVDNIVCQHAARHIDNEHITLYGEPLVYEPFLYYMMHKPKGVLSASKDAKQPTAIDLLQGINPLPVHVVGRLDIDSTGFLLLTNNGALAHTIISPKTKFPKHYLLTLRERLTPSNIQQLESGIELDGIKTKPCRVIPIEGLRYEVILIEGRYHQIKKMMHAVANEVLSLHRTQIGPLALDASLQPGEHRALTKEEVIAIKSYQKT
jgi:16S rRNA pseudouridine516 synthase